MHVLVLGAAGFIGTELVRQLAGRGHQVTGCGRSAEKPGSLPPQVGWISADLSRDTPPLPADTDAVFYLPQSPHYRDVANRLDDLLAVNVLGAVRTALAARAAGCRFFCYASTGNVYAPSFAPLREDNPLRRDQGYALSKVMAEESLALVRGEMACISARLFGVYGPGQSGMLVPNIIDRVRKGATVSLQPGPAGDGNGLRVSLCHVEDAAQCLAQLAELANDGHPLPAALNIAGPEAVCIRQLAEQAGEALGLSPLFAAGDTPRPFDLVADITRLRELLNPTFIPLHQGMAETIGISSLV